MQVKEGLIKEIQDMPPEDVMNVYELVLMFNQLEKMPFVATDEILLSVARSIRARVINPLHGPGVISP
jgi:hypothetical protein